MNTDSNDARSPAPRSGDGSSSLWACPKCHLDLPPFSERSRCPSCGFELRFRDGVLVARDESAESYFDTAFPVMLQGNRMKGTWDLFYEQQAREVEKRIRPGEVIVDIGCGPDLPYRLTGVRVVGVDASFPSIRSNDKVDHRVFASATELPLKSGSVDAIVCFYSIHHMTGETVSENRLAVSRVFEEFSRVLKPAGRLMVFDVSPRWPFQHIEKALWNLAKVRLGRSLDMFFWHASELRELGNRSFAGAGLSVTRFRSPALMLFPPVFSKPGLRIPRLLYPFDINLYVWEGGGGARA